MAEGYKAWAASEVLDAGDLNDYASSQAVMRFANAAGRDAALNVAVVREGMLAYLKDTNVLTVNTDGTLTGWIQIFPVVTASIQDGNVTNAKLAANSVATGNIIDGTITGTDIAGGTITGANIQDGSIGPSDVGGGTYGISISGNAATATSATSASTAGFATSAGTASTATLASTAGNANTVGGYSPSISSTANTVAVRDAGNEITAGYFVATDTDLQFYSQTNFTYIGLNCARVANDDEVYSDIVTGRAVIVSSFGTLGTASSSLRYKENIEPLPYLPADILKLRPITYRYKEEHLEEESERPVEVGLIAEEVAALGFEELIYRDKEGQAEGIAYERLAVLLVKVCQDQQTQLDALSARLDALEANGAN
jgi:hypothetical protein